MRTSAVYGKETNGLYCGEYFGGIRNMNRICGKCVLSLV